MGKSPTMNPLSNSVFPAVALLVAMTSCAVTADRNYVGKIYPATADVEVFLDWKDLPHPYETMGYIVIDAIGVLGGYADTPATAQRQIEQIARENGADAVVIGPAALRLWPATYPPHTPHTAIAAGNGTTGPVLPPDCNLNRQLAAAFIKYKSER